MVISFHRSVACVVMVSVAALFASSDATAADRGSMHHATANAHGDGSTAAYARIMETMHHRMRMPLSGDPDVDFVRQMIPHHQAALDMAKVELTYGHDQELKRFSRWVVMAQTQEIAFMQQWLRRRDNGAVCQQATDFYGEAMATMHEGMMIAYTGNADVDFARGMIPHHQGAVAMAGILLAHGTDPELRVLAANIQRGQGYEIAWLQHWLTHQGDTTFPTFNP